MIKAINATGWAIALVGILVGETIHPALLVALAAASGSCFWLSHALHKEVLHHRYSVQDAPIASQLSRDLRIEV
jgi:xanthosine utilization system XapX-like protein